MQSNEKFSVKNILVAELKYFDSIHQGVEVMDPLSMILVTKQEMGYVNILKPEESLTTFTRVPYSNDYHFEDFGTKLRLVSSNCCEGPCWILREQFYDFPFSDSQEVTYTEVEDYVLSSSEFFKDRIEIAENRMKKGKHPFQMARLLKKDRYKQAEMDLFLEDRAKQVQKRK